MDATQVPAGEFKTHCLQLIDQVAASGEPLTITKRGRPVARLVPLLPERALFGALKGSVRSQHDLVSPVGADWDAER